MQNKPKQLILMVLTVVIGLPVVLVTAILAWGWISDQTNGTVVSSGVTRRYLLYVPNTYDRSRPAPLVISFHPAATWPAFEMHISRWNDLADQHGFIVVYPAGTDPFFDGEGRGPHVFPLDPLSLSRGVRFISDLIDKLEAEYHIDPNRIYVNGMSNGAGMAFELSCKLSDRIAAVGAVASAQAPSWDCGDSKPVPTVAFHGTADRFAPYHGGSSPIAPRPFPSIPAWMALVARRNLCTGDPRGEQVSRTVRRLQYTTCAQNADVVLYTIEGGGHTWPGGIHLPEWIAGHTTDDIDASSVMWDFFVQHPLRID